MRRVQRASSAADGSVVDGSVVDGSVVDGSVAETRVGALVRLIAQSYTRRSVRPRVPSSGTREQTLERKDSERPRSIAGPRTTQRVRGQVRLQPLLPSPDCHTVPANRQDHRSLPRASGTGAGPVPASGLSAVARLRRFRAALGSERTHPISHPPGSPWPLGAAADAVIGGLLR